MERVCLSMFSRKVMAMRLAHHLLLLEEPMICCPEDGVSNWGGRSWIELCYQVAIAIAPPEHGSELYIDSTVWDRYNLSLQHF